jgi:hypothetical protein
MGQHHPFNGFFFYLVSEKWWGKKKRKKKKHTSTRFLIYFPITTIFWENIAKKWEFPESYLNREGKPGKWLRR